MPSFAVRQSKQTLFIFLSIKDEQGLIDVTVLPHTQEKYAKAALGCALLLVEGTVRKTGPGSISITGERLFDLRRLGKR